MLIWAEVFLRNVWRCREGKRGSVRVLLAFKQGHYVFFVFGFARRARANISGAGLKALRRLADELLNYGKAQINKALGAKELIEVLTDE